MAGIDATSSSSSGIAPAGGATRCLRVFLFTDLVGSTELFSQLSAHRAEEVRTRHFDVLRELVEKHGGQLVKTLGDGIMAAFPVVAGALDCAVAAQQRLSIKEGQVSLRGLRAGLSAGEVTRSDTDYHGSAVVEAARLCTLARPSEILASRVVQLLAGTGTEHAFAEVGARRLKGLPAPVDVDALLWSVPEAAAPRVLLADDAVVVRQGIARVLEDDGCQVIGQAADADELLRLAAELAPDVVVTDIRMPPSFRLEGLEAALELRRRFPGVGVLVLSQHLESQYASDLLADNTAGVGYLLKERIVAVDVFTAAVRRVAAGGVALDPEIVAALMSRRRVVGRLAALTDRQRQLLALMAEGLSRPVIAKRLDATSAAIESEIAAILEKLQIPIQGDDDRRAGALLLQELVR